MKNEKNRAGLKASKKGLIEKERIGVKDFCKMGDSSMENSLVYLNGNSP
ncbi:hypothetical protein AusDCA_3017 [Desulfitobacterium sp. AusDCA]